MPLTGMELGRTTPRYKAWEIRYLATPGNRFETERRYLQSRRLPV
jgi:hypothetical protein